MKGRLIGAGIMLFGFVAAFILKFSHINPDIQLTYFLDYVMNMLLTCTIITGFIHTVGNVGDVK